jgi:hypothetical protein
MCLPCYTKRVSSSKGDITRRGVTYQSHKLAVPPQPGHDVPHRRILHFFKLGQLAYVLQVCFAVCHERRGVCLGDQGLNKARCDLVQQAGVLFLQVFASGFEV